ncbi:D-alanyl-D-alanine carboxypeptidase family protein [Haloplasma contractile]|uniref:D-alanyl-D-alanine carboxypeptidase penicillin-binding protein 5-6 n=1 Tax=Haloplasma contractile SSD-17B TaxID=1033810 RepID=F7Q192_9MOLU|nr:D-alanyl-D-alanine carboxypeptidase family protein [Haloplasma contractile]ERJ12809.1 D-alanyl-D-alanine carboxypeptidase penicillin-binding protein 5-6 [Haloplasma contractile SSD-17B]
MKKRLLIIISFIMVLLINFGSTVQADEELTADAPFVSADCATLLESNSGRVLFQKDAHKRRPIASISKIMTAIVAIENKRLDDMVTVDQETTLQIGSSIYLQEGDSLTLEDLIYGLMLRSGNDAAYLIAKYVGDGDVNTFYTMMNEKAKEIGMNNSTFENSSGLDETTKNISTAYDMALLMQYAMNNPMFRKITGTEVYKTTTQNGRTYVWTTKHRLIKYYDDIIGGKTGYTKLAKRTLVTVSRKDELELITVTLNGPNDWQDHKRMFDYGFNQYEMKTFMRRGIFEVPNDQKDLYFNDHDILYPVKANELKDYKFVIEVRNEASNEANLILKHNGEEIMSKPVNKADMSHLKEQDDFFDVMDLVTWIDDRLHGVYDGQ